MMSTMQVSPVIEPTISMGTRCTQLFVLNVVDMLITLFAVTYISPDCEANFLMSATLAHSLWVFICVKLVIGSYLFWKLYNCKSEGIRRYGSTVCLAFYWGVVIQNCALVLAVQENWLV